MVKHLARFILAAFVTTTISVAPTSASLSVHLDSPVMRSTAVNRAAPPLPVTCDGDGRTGRRVQFLYGFLRGTRSRLARFRPLLQTRAAQVDNIYYQSSANLRNLRIVHSATAPCLAVIPAIPLSKGALAGNLTKVQAELSRRGFKRTDRKYIVFSEIASRRFGGIAQIGVDESADSYNGFNQFTLYGLISRGFPGTPSSLFWSELATAHEVGHTLGAVQLGAPHSTGAFHCTDGEDVMCYDDRGPLGSTYSSFICPGESNLLDCNDDDYYSTVPVGAYLPTHWNVANSEFLIGAPAGPLSDLSASWSTPTLQPVRRALFFAGTLTVSNLGVNSTRSSVIEYYLSTDSVLDTATDQRLGVFTNFGTLGPGSSPLSIRFKLPGRAQRLGKFLIAMCDGSNVLPESDETNNAAVALQISR